MDDMRSVAREEADEAVEEALEPIRTTLWGPPHPSGDGRVTTKGMEHKVTEMHHMMTNGGIPRAKMERRTKLWVAAFSVMGGGGFLLLNTWLINLAASP